MISDVLLNINIRQYVNSTKHSKTSVILVRKHDCFAVSRYPAHSLHLSNGIMNLRKNELQYNNRGVRPNGTRASYRTVQTTNIMMKNMYILG